MSYDLGDSILLGITTYNDATGVAEDATSVTLTLTLPDATTTAPTLTHVASSGVYQCRYTPATVGRYRRTFTVVGTATVAGGVAEDVFDVWPANPRFIISLADAKAELNMPSNVTEKDDELRLYIAATTFIVENIVGSVLTQTITETRNGGKSAVLLSERITSVTSVTVDGSPWTNYVADLDAGIIYGGSSRWPLTFTPGRQNIVVTYTSGGSSVDPNIILASRIIAAHLYQVGQQGGAGRGRNGDPGLTLTAAGFLIPNRAAELLETTAERGMPGIA